MAKQTTLDDIAESIADLATMMAVEFGKVRQETADGFASVRQEMADEFKAVRQEIANGQSEIRQEMQAGFAEVHRNQHETNVRLDRLEGNQEAHEADIKELYKSRR